MLKIFNKGINTCGACSYATIIDGLGFDISVSKAIEECRTSMNGTHTHYVASALTNRGIKNSGVIHLSTDFKSYSHWLELNSYNRILYVGFHGRNKGKRGRPTEEHHAVVVSNGMVYDCNFEEGMPIDAYAFKYNHAFFIEEMIMVDTPEFKRYLDDHEEH